MTRRILLSLVNLFVLGIGMAGHVRVATAANTIESTYAATGSFSVSTANVTDTSGTVIYNLYYPTNLSTGGLHPIITWGNGTNALPSNYWGLLNHLASWGFVVVASTDLTTGTGAEILAAANYMVQQNSNSGSIFYQKLDTTHVGAIGHSQGAGGVVNATNNSNGLIKTTVPIALPNQIWVSAGDEYYVQSLTVPVTMAVDEINAGGGVLGKPVTYTLADDATDPNVASESLEGLLEDSKVDAIMGPTSSGITLNTKRLTAGILRQ